MMNKHAVQWSVLWMALALAGCSSDEGKAPAATPQSEPTTGSEMMPSSGAETAVVMPAPDKLRTHIMDHITYPATRAQVLEACAQTTEFSPGEKEWIEQHLPEGTYNSADDVMNALGAASH